MKPLTTLLLFVSTCAFTQQSLDEYIAIATENNPGLRATYLEFEAEIQRIPQMKSLPDPSLSIGYFINPIETRIGPQRVKFSLTQMFPWFGTLEAKENVATHLAATKYQEFIDARNELYLKVKVAYYPIFEVQEQLKWKKENLEILTTYKSLATTSFSNGKGAMADVIRVDIMSENVRTDIDLLQQKIKPLEVIFNNLLNRDVRLPVRMDSLSILLIPSDYRRDSVVAHNPKIQRIALKIQAASASEEVARKQTLPKIGLGLDYTIIGRLDNEVQGNGKNALMPMVSMSLPIFRKKNKAAIKQVQLAGEALKNKKKNIENDLLSAYELAWYKLRKATQMNSLYTKQMASTQLAIDLLHSAYSNSGREFNEVLRMQQELLKYKMAKATTIKNFNSALAQLDYLTAK